MLIHNLWEPGFQDFTRIRGSNRTTRFSFSFPVKCLCCREGSHFRIYSQSLIKSFFRLCRGGGGAAPLGERASLKGPLARTFFFKGRWFLLPKYDRRRRLFAVLLKKRTNGDSFPELIVGIPKEGFGGHVAMPETPLRTTEAE